MKIQISIQNTLCPSAPLLSLLLVSYALHLFVIVLYKICGFGKFGHKGVEIVELLYRPHKLQECSERDVSR